MLRQKLVCSAAVCAVFGGGFAMTARADSITDLQAAINTYLDGNLSTVNRVVFEDDDFSALMRGNTIITANPQPGDKLVGMFKVTSITGLDSPNPSTNVNSPGTALEVTAAFELELKSIGTDVMGTYLSFGVPTSYSYLTAAAAVNNTVIEIYADDGNSNAGTQIFNEKAGALTSALATAQDGQLWGLVGFTNSGNEFYRVYLDNLGSPDSYQISLNFTQLPPAQSEYLVNNGFGTKIFVQNGDLFPNANSFSNSYLTTASDGDFVLVYAPVPAAAWTGISVLACLAGFRAYRGRRS